MKRISKGNVTLAMSPNNEEAMRVASGDTIIFETCDCFSDQIQREDQPFSSVGWDQINPATGPVYVEDAEPGDILKVEILDIKIADHGVMTVTPKLGVLRDYVSGEKTKIIPVQNGHAIFNKEIQIPVNPMIGVIGTAPGKEEIPNGTPGTHGGNMDCKRIVKGSTLYLPVNTPGGLLGMGDVHAVMADGEIVICGLEIAAEVTVKVTILRGRNLPLPMLEEGDHIMTIASEKTLDEAAKMATINMHSFLVEQLNMDRDEAGMLLSLVGDLRICQVVDPLMTARMELPKCILEKYHFRVDE